MNKLIDRLSQTCVLPVVTIEAANQAVPLAQALLAGGITAIEITLRTPAALEGIQQIAKHVPKMFLGAGTVLSAADLQSTADAGAQFAVSPGATPNLLSATSSARIPLLPGVANASDIMLGLEHGLSFFKLFPASTSGGVDALKSFAGPFGNIKFCPTGGINLQNAKSYLSLPNVVCIGGSWIVPLSAIRQGRWDEIERLAKEATTALKQ